VPILLNNNLQVINYAVCDTTASIFSFISYFHIMKKLFYLLIFLLASATASFAQEVDIKKNIVLVDNKEAYKIKKSNAINVSITDLEDNELVVLRFIHNSVYGSVYNKVIFLEQDITFTTQSYVFTPKMLVKKLLEDKVLKDGKVDEKKAYNFAVKYDERVENKFDRR
jgi:hypothetical protein